MPWAAFISKSRPCCRKGLPIRRWPTAASASLAATPLPVSRSACSDGIGMQYAGKVRKVDSGASTPSSAWATSCCSTAEGPSPTGENFNLQMEEAAERCGGGADKLVYLTDSKGVTDQSGELLDAMTADEASINYCTTPTG